jgi:hypothetical protein
MKYSVAIFSLVLWLAGCDKGANPSSASPVDTTLRLVLLKPAGGETYHVGDSVPLSFEYRNSSNTVHFVTLWFSPDNGKSWDMPVFINSIHYTGARKDTVWVIPADTTYGSYVSDSAKIKVEDYADKATVYGFNAQPFRILP